jgi:hypothetical protein
MNDTWQKIKLWTKLSLIGLVVLFLLLFVYKNYSYPVTVWLFRDHTMSVLELLVFTFLFGVVLTLLARPIYRTLGQIAELRKPHASTSSDAPPPPSTTAAEPIKPQS